MSGAPGIAAVMQERVTPYTFDAYVVAAAFDRASSTLACALGDGTVALVDSRDPARTRRCEAHDGAVLALAADCGKSGFLTGGDDGTLARIGDDGAVRTLASFGSKWVEQLASNAAAGVIAAGVGRSVHVFDADGRKLKTLDHPSTVTGIAFDAKGRRIGASHYNGASLWYTASKTDNPRVLAWKGSHTGIAIHPAGEAVVTAMQDNALHGWRLSDGQHMRMSGYPGKTHTLSFSRTGKWLATDGAEAIVLWPFFGGGPMGKAPLELAAREAPCTRVAFHPRHDAVAAGFADGVVLVAEVQEQRILPVIPAGKGPVSALAWSDDGAFLAFGTETGFAALADFSRK
jgi:WD40 repeat protein